MKSISIYNIQFTVSDNLELDDTTLQKIKKKVQARLKRPVAVVEAPDGRRYGMLATDEQIRLADKSLWRNFRLSDDAPVTDVIPAKEDGTVPTERIDHGGMAVAIVWASRPAYVGSCIETGGDADDFYLEFG